METLLWVGLANAAMATLLAVIAALASRLLIRRPSLVHALWLLVLLKLVTPPLVYFSIPLPGGTASGRVESAPTPGSDRSLKTGVELESNVVLDSANVSQPVVADSLGFPEAVLEPAAPALIGWSPWQPAVLAVWLAGAVVVWSAAAVRLRRLRQLIALAQPAPAELREQIRGLARQLGLARGPDAWLIPAPLPPMLWAGIGKPRLLLPRALWNCLSEEQRETLLVHELGHLRWRDHWVRRLELVALGLYWWLPVAWWARRELQEAEEERCDALVVQSLPASAGAYAQTLLDAVAFLSRSRLTAPLGTSGMGQVRVLKRRLIMIVQETKSKSMSRTGSRIVLLLGAMTLPWLPLWARPPAAEPKADEPVAQSVGQKANEPDNKPPESHPFGFITSSTTDQAAEQDKATRLQQARDEVELLEAQLAVRKAHLLAAKTALEPAKEHLDRANTLFARDAISSDELSQARKDVSAAEAQIIIKQAEMSEAEVRLRQARRRLTSLEAPAKSLAPQQQQRQLDQLEKKLDDLRHDIEVMRHNGSAGSPADSLRRVWGVVPVTAKAPELEAGDTIRKGPNGQDIAVMHTRSFQIPFVIDANHNQAAQSLMLYVSRDEGKTWRLAEKANSAAKHFTFKTNEDGLYWFAVLFDWQKASAPIQPQLKVFIENKSSQTQEK